ncbi:hypothetical protein BESB_058490 [Besnoitia besnoiti]|uniref:Uncharacterized protein n=1 Tax=Besnoitia besnoiti TaxID=94643 RepID=A0A2A9MHT8_BESBE|nr:hypothetical protein BESB_058490 [Besnoitia besnoiti]PFH34962.1 hypothetical protein BESB_058490 [Besnoitia besnoiti]
MDPPGILPLYMKGRKLVERFNWDQRERDLRQAINTIAVRLGELHKEDVQNRQTKFINEERQKRRLLVTDTRFPCCTKERPPGAAVVQGASHGMKPLPGPWQCCLSASSRRSTGGAESTSSGIRTQTVKYGEAPSSLASTGSRSSHSQRIKTADGRRKRMLVPLPTRHSRCVSRRSSSSNESPERPRRLCLVDETSGNSREYPMYNDDDLDHSSLLRGNKTVASYLARTVALVDRVLERDQSARIEQFRKKFCCP